MESHIDSLRRKLDESRRAARERSAAASTTVTANNSAVCTPNPSRGNSPVVGTINEGRNGESAMINGGGNQKLKREESRSRSRTPGGGSDKYKKKKRHRRSRYEDNIIENLIENDYIYV